MIGCSRPAAYSFFIAIDSEGWKTKEYAVFSVDSLLQPRVYDCTLHLRTTTAHPYPYKKIFAEVTYSHKDSVAVITDTVCFNLSESLEKGTAKGISMHTHSLQLRSFKFHPEQTNQITVRHLMQESPISGIIAVGIELSSKE